MKKIYTVFLIFTMVMHSGLMQASNAFVFVMSADSGSKLEEKAEELRQKNLTEVQFVQLNAEMLKFANEIAFAEKNRRYRTRGIRLECYSHDRQRSEYYNSVCFYCYKHLCDAIEENKTFKR